MIGVFVFLVGVALWVCKSNSFLMVNGWAIFFCLSLGFFTTCFQSMGSSMAKNINKELTEKIKELGKQNKL